MNAGVAVLYTSKVKDLDSSEDARRGKELIIAVKGCRADHVCDSQQVTVVQLGFHLWSQTETRSAMT